MISDRFTYTPFADLASHTGTTDILFQYNGRDGVMNDNNGLYYMRARYYAPEFHRFINRDVLLGGVASSKTLNRYGYVGGNPIGLIDPTGLNYVGGYENVENFFHNPIIQSMAKSCYGENASTLGCMRDQFSNAVFSLAMGCVDIAVKDVLSCADNPGVNLDCISSIPLPSSKLALVIKKIPFPAVKRGSLPDSIFSSKAPKQTTPGTKMLEGQYINDKGRVEPWEAYYDNYGRQIGRTDYNAGNKAQGIPDTHHHTREFNAEFPMGISTGDHLSGGFLP